jgi:hypothetical protein
MQQFRGWLNDPTGGEETLQPLRNSSGMMRDSGYTHSLLFSQCYTAEKLLSSHRTCYGMVTGTGQLQLESATQLRQRCAAGRAQAW